MRLQVWLSKSGIASRRAAEKIIRAGRVSVNGTTVTTMGFQVGEGDRVICDGRLVTPLRELIYLAIHKPVAVLCTQYDEKNRPKVIDVLPDWLRPGLFHVGRLDFMSSGLIFYTNDGDFAKIVTHPSSEIEKEYLLETENPVSRTMLKDYQRGVSFAGDVLRVRGFTIEKETRVRLTLIQGKNREIRRVCAVYGVKIRQLRRIRIGCIRLEGISPGRFRHLTTAEVDWFTRRAQGKGSRRPSQKTRSGLDQSSSL